MKKYVTRSRGCYRCPIRCKAQLQFHDAKFNGVLLARPEFESVAALGPRCGLSHLETVVYLDNLCSQFGLDSISTGAAIAFAMELYQRGILTTHDTGGLKIRWGDREVMETLIRQMAYVEGLGAVLSQGVRRAAQVIGQGAEQFAPHVKGLELSAYHPRKIMGTALGYAVVSRGGDFSHVYPSLEYRWSSEKAMKEFNTPLAVDIHAIAGKGALVKRVMTVSAVLDCLGLCKVPSMSLMDDFDLESESELTSAFIGQPVDANMLFNVGERVVTLERLFNIKHGATRDDDCLPSMFLKDEQNPIPLEPMLQDFYASMGGSWVADARDQSQEYDAGDYWHIDLYNFCLKLVEEAPGTVWVDFDYAGAFEYGTYYFPFNTLGEALGAASDGESICIMAGSTSETPTIDMEVTLHAVGGTVTIGEP